MFQPIIPLSGLGGLRFLQDTYDSQFEAFTQSAQLQRDSDYFRENIGKVESAEDLVSDYRLLSITLGAFSLHDDINSQYFIRKILEEGTTNEDSLANRFTDPNYKELSEAFGFGPGETLKIGEPLFAEKIINQYEAIEFEIATGEQNETMRFALYAEREMGDLANDDMSNDAKWYTIMGDAPLRNVFEKALNLPSSFGEIDLEQQLGVFKERAAKEFGTDDLSVFNDSAAVQDLVTKYVVRDQLADFSASSSSNAIALTLLTGR